MTSSRLLGSPSAVEVTRSCLENIDSYNGALRAIITPLRESALVAAGEADQALASGESLGPLHGMPISLKDVFDVAGARTTLGTSPDVAYTAETDSFIAARLRDAGAVIIAKDNLSELCLSVTNQNAHHGRCRNPWDPQRIPGGSSGGSGVAVASGMSVAAIGTDDGGSVRIPASLNGLVGLRPTTGRLSGRHNGMLGPLAFSVPGPIARDAVTVARIFDTLDCRDEEDPSACDNQPRGSVLVHLTDGLKDVRIGVPRRFFFEDVDPQILSLVESAISVLASLGADVVDVDVPGVEDVFSAFTRILTAQYAVAYRELLQPDNSKVDEGIRRRLEIGGSAPAADYAAAVAFRLRWIAVVRRLFAEVDMLAMPTVPIRTPRASSKDELTEAGALTRLTYPQAFSGIPAISIPGGFDGDGMPVGFQLCAGHWREDLLLRAAVAYQAVTHWHQESPDLRDS